MAILKDLFGLDGKVTLITGASKGLGAAYALGLAEAGSDIALFARSDTAELKKQIEEKFGRRVISVRGDVAIEGDAKRAVAATVAQLGAIDVLVANAGSGVDSKDIQPAHLEDSRAWRHMLDVDLDGTYFFCKHVLAEMVKQKRGKVITTASMWGFTACPIYPAAAYCAAKGAVINLTRELAKQYGEYGITVNSLAPGFCRTEIGNRSFYDPKIYQAHVDDKTNLLHVVMEPADLVGTMIYLASKASDFMTGHTVVVDMGCVAV